MISFDFSIGLISFPTALVNKDENILKCTPCGDTICVSDLEDLKDENGTVLNLLTEELDFAYTTTNLIDIDWINAYCLINDLGTQVQYFPFILIFLPVCLCLVQKIANM